ncbi:hypothetical protein [Streptomyces sp. NPDC056921]|uniref:hypothetical protein n=1 Tax=Streptomyces sp. NPDC056921 TaxID=3345966 RepID=UPI003624FC6C
MDATALIAVVESPGVPLRERLNAAITAINTKVEPAAMNQVISALLALNRDSMHPSDAATVALLLGKALRTVGEDEQAYASLTQPCPF